MNVKKIARMEVNIAFCSQTHLGKKSFTDKLARTRTLLQQLMIAFNEGGRRKVCFFCYVLFLQLFFKMMTDFFPVANQSASGKIL
jgi:hypothetical protein